MSLRALRRSLIAALAVGGSLAIVSSASAIPVPIGSSTDQPYPGSGIPTSVYSLYNEASNVALVPAENLIYGANALSQAPFNFGTAVDASFSTKFTMASQLTSSNVAEIATDVAAPANNTQMEMSVCVFDVYPTQTHDPSVSNAFTACDAGGSPYLAAAVAAYAPATTSGTVQNGVAAAAAAWPDLSQLVGFLSGAAGVMQSADSATISSSGTITSLTNPVAYNITLSAPAGGYVVPSAFALTFPAGLGVNAALVADEVNAATNTAAVELNPSGTSIGTVTLTSPLADEFGGSNNQLVGNVYLVQTGQSSGQGSVTQPYIELWFPAGGHPIYDLGSFPSSLAFPLTLNFGEAFVSLLGAHEPLPLNSLALSFPAANSPAKTTSCSTLGTVGGAITDSIAGLAYEFGDANDGVSSLTGVPSAVNLTATATAVTDKCATLTASMAGLTSGKPTLSFKAATGPTFGTITVGLPGGLSFVKSKTLVKEVTGSKIKSVKIASGKLVITLKSKVRSETIKTKKGLIKESSGLIKKIKKHKTKTLSLSVKAGNTALKASFKA